MTAFTQTLVIGVNVQAYDADLTTISALATTDGNFIVGNGSTWVAESGADARTSLGCGTIATQAANSVAITGGTINGTTIGASTPAAGTFTNVVLSSTTAASDGVLFKEAVPFLHDFHHPTGAGFVPVGNNLFVGQNAGNFTAGSTAGATAQASNNVGVGAASLITLTTGYENVAIGCSSMYYNTTGYRNAALGYTSLISNISGVYNVALGQAALYRNTAGGSNVAVGASAMYSAKIGSNGVAIGNESQYYANDTTVAWTNYNVSVGHQALRGSTTAANNTGNYNTALGYQTLLANAAGSYLVALGYLAGAYLANGSTPNTTSDYSTYLGTNTKASADDVQNEIVIGYNAIGAGSNTITLGNTAMVKTVFPGDNNMLTLGAGSDATVSYDGTNLVINPKAVGSGLVDVQGAMQLGGDLNANGNTIHFGTAENVQTPAAGNSNTVTIDLGAENHHTLDCATSASGAVTCNLTVPPGPTAGTIIVKLGSVDITWTPSAGTARWLGTERTWDTVGDDGKWCVVSWRWDATNLFLSSTDTTA